MDTLPWFERDLKSGYNAQAHLAWFDAEHGDHHLVKINQIIEQLTKH